MKGTLLRCLHQVVSTAAAVLLGLGAQAAAAQTAPFDIPSQPLSAALDQFARQAGLQLAFSPELAKGKTSAAVAGTMEAQAALSQLLKGTGLEGKINGSTLTIQAAPRSDSEQHLPEVEVSGSPATIPPLPPAYAGGQVARGGEVGLLGNMDFMDTPFNQSSYTASTIENQQARSIADVVINDPSVRYSGTTTQTLDLFNIRGFLTRSAEVAYQGMFGIAPDSQLAVETVERVEVLKGPGALLYGMSPNGAVGGTINVVPKRAEDVPITRLTGLFQTRSQPGAHVDVGRRFGEDNAVGLRVNAVYRNGDTPVEDNSQEAGDATLALDLRGDAFRLFLDAGYQRRKSEGLDSDSYMQAGAQVPDAPDAGKTYFQDWTHMDSDATYGALRGEFDIAPWLSAFAAAGVSRNESSMVLSYAWNMDSAGNFDETFWGQASYNDNVTAEAGVRMAFDTGSVAHRVVASIAALRNESGNIAFFDDTIDGTGNRPSNPSNIYAPSAVAEPALGGFPTVPKISETALTGLALADTLSFSGDAVQLTVGARLQQVEVENFDGATGASLDRYDESAVTPAVGLIVKPWRQVSLYANYIEGLSQGPVAPAGSVNAGQVFPPSKTKQLEGGVKVEHGTLAATLSVFDITQPTGRTNASTLVFSVDAERRNRGIELNVFGQASRSTRVLGGVMLLDSRYTETEGGLNEGNRAPGAEVNLNLGGEWDTPFAPGLTLSARAIYTGSAYIDAENTQKIPGWTRIDAGARYAFRAGDKPVTLRANVENLFDEDYWRDEYLYRGAPRTFLLSASIDF